MKLPLDCWSKRQKPHAVALIITLLQFILVAQAECHSPSAKELRLAGLAADQDLAVRGVVQAVTQGDHTTLGGCSEPPSTYSGYEATIGIREVLVGSSSDSTVEMIVNEIPPQGFAVGATVVAYGSRACWDGWRMIGELLVVGGDGKMARMEFDPWPNDSGSTPTMSEFAGEVVALAEFRPLKRLLSAGGYCEVRVVGIDTVSSGLFYACDSMTAVGTYLMRCPAVVFQPNVDYCAHLCPDVGDTLVLPSTYSASDTLDIDPGCVGSLRIEGGMYWPLDCPGVALGDRTKGVGPTRRMR